MVFWAANYKSRHNVSELEFLYAPVIYFELPTGS